MASLLGRDTPAVHAFYHLENYVVQAKRHPDTFAQADIYVQCDCDDVDDDAATAAARVALAPGGVALLLRGDGTVVQLLGPPPAKPPRDDGRAAEGDWCSTM